MTDHDRLAASASPESWENPFTWAKYVTRYMNATNKDDKLEAEMHLRELSIGALEASVPRASEDTKEAAAEWSATGPENQGRVTPRGSIPPASADQGKAGGTASRPVANRRPGDPGVGSTPTPSASVDESERSVDGKTADAYEECPMLLSNDGLNYRQCVRDRGHDGNHRWGPSFVMERRPGDESGADTENEYSPKVSTRCQQGAHVMCPVNLLHGPCACECHASSVDASAAPWKPLVINPRRYCNRERSPHKPHEWYDGYNMNPCDGAQDFDDARRAFDSPAAEARVDPMQKVLRDQGMCGAYIDAEHTRACILDPKDHAHPLADSASDKAVSDRLMDWYRVSKELDEAVALLHKIADCPTLNERDDSCATQAREFIEKHEAVVHGTTATAQEGR